MVSVRLSACFVLINFLQKTVFPPCLPTFLCVSMFGVGKFRADCTLLVCPFLFGGIIEHENELVRFFFCLTSMVLRNIIDYGGIIDELVFKFEIGSLKFNLL